MIYICTAEDLRDPIAVDDKLCFVGIKKKNMLKIEPQQYRIYSIVKDRADFLSSMRTDIINLDKVIDNVLDPLWLASDLAENNICLENFSLYILNTLAVIKAFKSTETNIVLICDDDEQIFIYSHIFRSNGYNVVAKINHLNLSKRLLALLLNKCVSIFQSVYKIVSLKIIRLYYRAGVQPSILKQADILFINWIGITSFNNNKISNKDRYFGDLISQLNVLDAKSCVIGKPIDFTESFTKIAKNTLLNSKNAMFIQDFLTIRDVLLAFFKSFAFIKYSNYNLEVAGINFASLWKWYCFKDAIKSRIPSALETYYAANRFLRNTSKNVTILYPYENQPWEKLLSLSFRGAYPKNKIYAYQHFPFARDYLTAFPSKAYYSSPISPTILLSDKFFGEWLKESGFIDYKLFGNYRFKFQDTKDMPKSSSMGKRHILCSCSIQFDDSLELISKALKILANLEQPLCQQIKLIVNFHPYMKQDYKDYIKYSLSNEEIEIEWSSQMADELLDPCAIVLYNSNSICFNAALRGIPAVFVGSDLQINLDRMTDISLKAMNVDEGSRVIAKLLEDQRYYQEESVNFSSYFDSYYIEPSETTIRKILLEEVI